MRSQIGFHLFNGKKRRGFILVSVLMVSLFLVSASVGYGWFVRDQVKRVEMRRFELECRNIALLAVKNVIKGLASDQTSYDSVHQSWFGDHLIPLGDSYLVSVNIKPLNDKLPLRHVFLPDGATLRGEMDFPWKKAWEAVELPNLAIPMLDFIDKNREPRVGGHEKDFFINRVPTDPSAFALIPEIPLSVVFGSRDKLGLKDLFTTWCGPKLNVNTASPEVLALLEGIDEITAQEIAEMRKEKPFKNISEVANLPAFSGSLGPKLTNLLGTVSDYFLISLQISQFDSDMSSGYRVVVNKKNVLSWEEL